MSDIAAMGGRPTACVVNLGVRSGVNPRMLDQVYAGLRTAARRAATDIVGEKHFAAAPRTEALLCELAPENETVG